MTFRTYIALALLSLLFPLNEAYKLIGEDSAAISVNWWMSPDFNLLLSKDWFVKIMCLQIALVISATVMVILSKGKEAMLRAMCWLWLLFTLFELYRFFLNFNKDNYMIVYMPLPFVFFVMAGLFKYHSKCDVVFQVREFFKKMIRGKNVQASVATGGDSWNKS